MNEEAPFRVLFAGGELNPVSIAVLDALARATDLRVTVLASQPHRRGFADTFRRTYDQHGLGTIWRGGLRLVAAKLRLALRSFGVPLKGHGSLSEVAETHGLEVLPTTRINAKATVEALQARRPDLLLVAAFDQILKAPILAVPRQGCVNVHPSLLPARRGPNPFYWVIAEGDARTGVTFHRIDEGIDTGDLLLQEAFEVARGETEASLQRRSANVAARLAPDVVRALRDGTVQARPQPEEGASYDPQPPRGASKL